MRVFRALFCIVLLLYGVTPDSWGADAGILRGIVHDPQHRPVDGATVLLQSDTSQWKITAVTDADGNFILTNVPVGKYKLDVSHSGFQDFTLAIQIESGSAPVVHCQLALASVNQQVVVSTAASEEAAENQGPVTVLDRAQITAAPGADRTNSLAMITNYVPASYVVHDQLHIRGGHQVTWLIDGIPIPNTNIATNVGPQIDPKDIDYLEIYRGGDSAQFGDRTYGTFDVVPRTGFERDNEAELVTSFGSFYQTNDQLNFGSHTDRFAYYASVNGNRSNLGLETPVGEILHDAENGFGDFASLIYNATPSDQLRLITGSRRDFYQVPNTPDQQSIGIHDAEIETDTFAAFSWVHTFNSANVLTISPFYHYNRANYNGGPNDYPTSTQDNHLSQYGGGQVTYQTVIGRNNIQAGLYTFAQADNQLFGLVFNDGSMPNFTDTETVLGSTQAAYVNDQFKPLPWLTLNAGLRQTHFSGALVENATDPRAGVSLLIPKLNWVLRATYSQYYQGPPLVTASGPLLEFVDNQDLAFIPLRGERDWEREAGITIPWRGWMFDGDTYGNHAENFLDHNSIGNSDVYLPVTITGAWIRGWEVTVRSPRLWNRGTLHLAYANQIAQGYGALNGGLTDFTPPTGFFLLDHDQRDTLNVGGEWSLPWRVAASGNVYYGSGFNDGTPDGHLAGHSSVDLSLSRPIGDRVSISLTSTNIANRHLLIDNSQTFGGTHYDYPREIFVQVRYRFHYGR
jgi:outer membrane cobalamin receptor